jgi:hypothetical protein
MNYPVSSGGCPGGSPYGLPIQGVFSRDGEFGDITISPNKSQLEGNLFNGNETSFRLDYNLNSNDRFFSQYSGRREMSFAELEMNRRAVVIRCLFCVGRTISFLRLEESIENLCFTLVVLGIVLCLVSPMSAQQATADIRGFITDSNSAAIGNAQVTLVNALTQLSRTTQSLDTGTYTFAAVPAGTYKLTVHKEGFAEKQIQGIVLTVGQTASVDVVLAIGSVTQTVDVTGAPPIIDSTQSYIGTTIEPVEVSSLPLQSRQFANLAVLTPGVTLVYNGDPTERNRLMPSIAGGRARLATFNIDNADDSEDLDGGLLETVSLESVQEFQVITHRFTAEQGRAAYGIINVITKSGTNDWHGTGFELFRNKALNWRTHTEELTDDPKSAYKRNQYGGSFGGPIIKNRLFFFVSPEEFAQTTINIVNTQGIAPQLDGPETIPQDLFTLTAKLDANIGKNDLLSFRYSRETNSAVISANSLTPTENQGTNTNSYNTGVINLTSTLGPSRVNQLTFEASNWENAIPPKSIGPELFFPNGVTLGQGSNYPQSTSFKKYQLRDTFSFVVAGKGSHNVKVGVDDVLNPHAREDATEQTLPQYEFIGNSLTSPIDNIFYNVGQAAFEYNNLQRFGVFAQDDWRLNRKLTLNLGLRWDYYGGVVFNQDYSPTYLFLQSKLPSFAGKQAHTPLTNFGPRIGFAYALGGDDKMAIRGGYGLYFNFPIFTTLDTINERNPNPLVPAYLNSNPTGILNPDGTFYQYGQPLPPNQLVHAPLQNSVVDPHQVDPRYQHATIGFERRIAPNTVITADVLWSRGSHTAFANEINRHPGPGLPRPFAADGFNFPIRIEQTEGKSHYTALNLSVVHRYSKNFGITAWYTYSRCLTTSIKGADEGQSSIPKDENNPGGPENFGPCILTPNSKLLISPIWTLPYQFQLSSTARFSSAQRYNIIAGMDLNGDGLNNDLPPGIPTINFGKGANFFQMDLRFSKFFNLPREFGKIETIFEMYNLFNNINPTSYQGNATGSNFGHPTAFAGDPLQGEARLIQLGVRFSF